MPNAFEQLLEQFKPEKTRAMGPTKLFLSMLIIRNLKKNGTITEQQFKKLAARLMDRD